MRCLRCYITAARSHATQKGTSVSFCVRGNYRWAAFPFNCLPRSTGNSQRGGGPTISHR
jgi:hypothetical protein